MGRKMGINWFANGSVPTHTAGTLSSLSGTLTCGDEAVGEEEISLITSNNSDEDGGTCVVGDVLTFSNHSQTYVCTVAGTLSGSSGSQTMTTVKVYPALTTALTSSATVTIAASHVLNQCFNKFAYSFATRPLKDPLADAVGGQKSVTMVDPVSGLSLRLTIERQHFQTCWAFDILYGAELTDPYRITRICGESS